MIHEPAVVYIIEILQSFSTRSVYRKSNNLASSIRNLIYKLPLKLPNNLRFRTIGNEEIVAKPKTALGRTAQCPVSPAELNVLHGRSKSVLKQLSKLFSLV